MKCILTGFLVLIIIYRDSVEGYKRNAILSRTSCRFSMQIMGYPPLQDPFPPKRENSLLLQDGEVCVRFINSQGGEDVVVAAKPGDMLTSVAARAGVRIATSCRSGLCGTCSTDLEDPNSVPGLTYRPGYNVIRACVTKVVVPPGCSEMVLDVYRSNKKKSRNLKVKSNDDENLSVSYEELPDAMARFEEDWEKDFKPDYKAELRSNDEERRFPRKKPMNRTRKEQQSEFFREELSDDEDELDAGEPEYPRSVGTSRRRRRILSSIMNLNKKSKRYVPKDSSSSALELSSDLADNYRGQQSSQAADGNQSQNNNREKDNNVLPAMTPEEENEGRTMGASRLREAAYRRAMRKNAQVQFIREIESLALDSEDLDYTGLPENFTDEMANSLSEQVVKGNISIRRDYSGLVREERKRREILRKQQSNQSEEDLELEVTYHNFFPDYSRHERAPLHQGKQSIIMIPSNSTTK